MFNPSIYKQRRARLLNNMQRGIAVIPTAPEALRNGDAHFPYRFDSYFHYLSGFEEPEAVLIMLAGDKPLSILFCREKDIEREIWDGFRYGPEAACKLFGFDAAYPIAQLDEKLTELMGNQAALFHPLGAHAIWDDRILALRTRVQAKARSGITAPNEIHDVRMLLDEMRLIKDSSEIDTMRGAASISALAHMRAMRATRPGRMEFEIEA